MHILLPCFEFPPFCGAGAMRLGRFARHFAEAGAKVSVITANVSDYENDFPKVRAIDSAILETLPESVTVHRTDPVRNLSPNGITDKIVLDKIQIWNNLAYRTAQEIHLASPVDVIYTSANPLSAHLLGLALKHELNVPWIAEFRDAWTTNMLKVWSSKDRFELERKVEAEILKAADHIIVNIPSAMEELSSRYPFLAKERISVVTNSFDQASLMKARRLTNGNTQKDLMVITHVGTLVSPKKPTIYKEYSALVRRSLRGKRSFRRCNANKYTRSPLYLCKALSRLVKKEPLALDHFHLRLVGTFSPKDGVEHLQRLCRRLGIEDMVRFDGAVPYSEAVSAMYESSVLLLIQEQLKGGQRASYVPAKLYDYFATQKPILGLVPEGDAKDFLKKAGTGFICPPDDVNSIAATLQSLYEQHINGGIQVKPDHDFISQFESGHLAAKIHRVFRELVHSPTKAASL